MKRHTCKKLIAATALASVPAVIGLVGCHTDSTATATSSRATTRPVSANIFAAPPPKGGAQLWAENCTRCHNAPPPDRFSDAQWEVVVQHMRLRANLTGEEARKIAEFLKASN